MLYLNEDTVLKLLKWDETVAAIEVAMKSVSKDVLLAVQNPRSFTQVLNSNNLLLTMPGYLKHSKFGGLTCKLVTSFPNNLNIGLPAINANITLFDEKTGTLKAVIAATEITKWRTAAASVVATKSLCSRKINKELKILSILGCGEEGKIHADAFQYLFNFEEIRLWNRTSEKAKNLSNDLNKKLGRDLFKFFETVEECVRNADVIITATFADAPIVKKDWVKKGAHINAVGAGQNHFSELDEQIYLTSDVYIDYWPGAKDELAGLEALGVRFKGEIGSVIAGDLVPSKDGDRITVFQSLGMAVQDCVMARMVYDIYEKNKQDNLKKSTLPKLTMWMVYSSENWPRAEDLESSVKRIRAELYDLEFDRTHAANYDLGICFDAESVQRVLTEATRFSDGQQLCDKYLSGRLNLDSFCNEMINASLQVYLCDAVPYLPKNIIEKYRLQSMFNYNSEDMDHDNSVSQDGLVENL